MGVQPSFSQFSQGIHADWAYAEKVLRTIRDSNWGDVGQQILNKLAENGCQIVIEELPEGSIAAKDSATAAYVPFDDDHPNGVFVNTINIRPSDSSASRLVRSLVHEGGSHAASWANAPALHASPYNTDYKAEDGHRNKPDIILSPRDWIRAVILTELDAYAKEEWIRTLGAEQHDPNLVNMGAQSIMTDVSFQQMLDRTGNLEQALVAIANQCMTANFNNGSYQFGHFYVGNALDIYKSCERINQNPQGLIPVRMDLEDMLLIGETFGPNIVANEALIGRGDLSQFIFEDGEAQIKTLEETLGIADQSALPTLREALAERGMTPESFLAASKSSRTLNRRYNADHTISSDLIKENHF